MNVCCVKTEDLDKKIVKTTGSFLLSFENVFKNKKIYWIERSQAETDENYKQLIPYIMMTDGHGRFACYLRHGNEKRLHGLYSCGIGGHIDEVDKAGTIMETVKNGMYRELSEELKNFQKEKISLEYRGIINEVKTKVGLVHIGLVFFARCLEGYLPEPADELAGLEWKSIDEIKKIKKGILVGSGLRSYLAFMKNIYVEYVDAEFEIEFEKPFLFLTLPSIVFRSILGSRLHSIACISRQNTCRNCQFNKSCIYSTIFETILDKTTAFLPGRDKGSHPFRIKIKEAFRPDNPSSRIFLTVQLYGFAIQYLPYIFYALQQAGDRGLFKERAVYKIKAVRVHNENILKTDGNLNTDFPVNSWEYEVKKDIIEKAQRICIKTPLRFKVGGKYKKDFSAQDFLLCIQRRLITLSSLYGKYELEEVYTPSPDIKISEADLNWKDYSYHSHRQEKIISLGGIEGSFVMKGGFTDYENHLLNFADIFGAGKNTNFGLGNIELL